MKSTMRSTYALELSTPSDVELAMTRAFLAPRQLVFDAFTRPEVIQRWLLGPDGWSMPVCEVDLRVGGAYRYVWRRAKDGSEMGTGGVFREIVAPERIVCSEQFDDPWYEGESVVTTVFVEEKGRTVVTQTMRFASREIRDKVLGSGMDTGVERSYQRLDELLGHGSTG